MSLLQIGTQCFRCHTIDFLPIKCQSCEHTFCREHVFQHDCLSSSVTASSPSVSRPPKSTLEGRCQVPACSNKRMTTWNLQGVSKATGETKEDPETLLTTKGDEVVCRLCRGAFCLSHRNPTTHSCNPPPPTISAAKAHTQSLIASLNPASSKPSSSAPLLSSASPATKPPPPKKRKVNPALELMRLKQQAKAGSRGEVHERSDRWHLKIGVDLEGETVRRKIRGEDGEEIKDGTYWRKDLTVGQIIQSLVTSRSISHNPIAGDPSTLIHLLHISPSSLATMSLLLDPLTRIDTCTEDGAEVWLVRGDSWRSAVSSS